MAMKVGVIGCGNISGAYLNNGPIFGKQMQFVACADRVPEAAKASAEKYNLKAMTVEKLLADPKIDMVLNLTTPQGHVEINTRALEAGKHVYCEKPFALDRKEGKKVIALAKKNKLRAGCAPDTFLGGGHQRCRNLIDENLIGKVVAGTAFMMNHGHESWHPAPAFYYLKGGGPLFDMGPYYITALVNMLGPVKKVVAINSRSVDTRIGIRVNAGKTFPVEVDTHIAATLEFKSGAIITLITSFDTWMHSCHCNIELQGINGALHVPDPNSFNGEITFFKAGLTSDWAKASSPFIYNDNMRGIGLADMADAVVKNRKHRASGELAFHVLDVMCSIGESSSSGKAVKLESTCERPDALPLGLKTGELK